MGVVWMLYGYLVLGLIGWYKIWTPLKNWDRRWGCSEVNEMGRATDVGALY